MNFWDIKPADSMESTPGSGTEQPASIWVIQDPYNPAGYKPAKAATKDWEISKFTGKGGKIHTILKSNISDSYLELSESQSFVWELMDGSHSVSDLVVEVFLRFHTLSIEGLSAFIDQLQSRSLLSFPPKVDVYRSVQTQLSKRSQPANIFKRLFGIILQSEFSVPGIDRIINTIYKLLGWLVFSKPVQFLLLLVTLVGLPFFYLDVKQGDLSFFIGAHGMAHVGLVTLVAAQIMAVFVHELSHALTTKYYHRRVRRGGVGLYFGMLAFFVDTTDIWMAGRKSRMAVTWAGPYSGFILGAVASITLMIHPISGFIFNNLLHTTPTFYFDVILPLADHRSAWAGFMYQFATFCYGIAFLNLNPLLQLDGYYILMDWLDIPMLRERSITFVRQDLKKKIQKRERFNREEGIFAIFGLLALAWTGLAVFFIIELYGGQLYNWLAGILGNQLAWIVLLIAGGAIVIYYLWRNLLVSHTRRMISNA